MHKAGYIEKGVMFGHDGYLFLLDGGHHVFDLILGRHKVPDESYSNFEDNITRRATICQKAGVPFLHVIYPDKQSVLVDKFPVEAPICMADVYLDRLPDVRKWVHYPRHVLQTQTGATYMRTDTHLTELGNIIAAGAIVAQLIGESQAANVNSLLTSHNWNELTWVGDLGSRFEPALSEKRRLLRKSWLHKWFRNDLKGGNNGIVDLLFSSKAIYGKRILVFGDSFSRELSSILSFFFKEVVFLRTPYFHDDLFHQIQPDLVITSNVERYLSFCESDDRRPSFFLYPYINGIDYAPDKAFAEAFSASLSYGRAPYWDFLKKHGLADLHPAA
jgi:hypothetical protein